MRAFAIGIVTALFMTFFVGEAAAQASACEQEVRAACAQGGCPSVVVQKLYTRCMIEGPGRGQAQTQPGGCEQEVRTKCAKGGCPSSVVQEIYTQCMLRGSSGAVQERPPTDMPADSVNCGNGNWCYPGDRCGPTSCLRAKGG